MHPVTVFTSDYCLNNLRIGNKLACYITLGWKDYGRGKRFSLLDPFVNYKEKSVVNAAL